MVAKNNRTVVLHRDELENLKSDISTINTLKPYAVNETILGDINEIGPILTEKIVDVLFIDPPYNINKTFNNKTFYKLSDKQYEYKFNQWIESVLHTLKDTASIYVCCDWQNSHIVRTVLENYFIIRNRITWQREKGRGAKNNWKNCSEDIWFATKSNDFIFNTEAVKLKKRVLAPYKNNGEAKDWAETEKGKFRFTYPSNLWTDLTVPFWSMPENTNHPTQKPEKLLAKIILASSNENDVIFDPFVGSGTTSVVAKKLNRRYIGIDIDEEYCLLTEKRLYLANQNRSIQGYADNIFYERNSKLK